MNLAHFNIPAIANNLWRNIDANSPAILTALSVTGTISTAVLAVRATFQAAEDLWYEENKDAVNGYQKLPLKGRVALIWPLYIPTAIVGCTTVASIIAANTISSKRTTALVTAMTLTEKAYAEYQEKVNEHLTPAKQQKIKDEIAQDHIRNSPVRIENVSQTGGGDTLCYDSLSSRYFRSSMETLRKGMNDVNQRMITSDGYASLNDLYDQWNLGRIAIGEDLGWTAEMPVDLQISTMLSEDGSTPTLHIGYSHLPIAKYYRQH